MTEGINLYLIRHGNTFNAGDKVVQVGLQTDIPLTSKGMEQANNLGRYFKNNNIIPSSIYCGNLTRQNQSAQIIAEVLNFKNTIFTGTEALSEIDYGPWEGLTCDEIDTHWPQQHNQWNNNGTWPEDVFIGSFNNKIKLLNQLVTSIKTNHQAGDNVFLVTSNGIIRLFVTLIDELWANVKENNNMSEYKVKTGNYCQVLLADNTIKVKGWNLSAYTHRN